MSGGEGIYIASKVKHAQRWVDLRDVGHAPIVSTWIDEAGEGESGDLADLWRRCIAEASHASALVIYREADEILKGAWVELGAALACGVPVFAYGLKDFTVSHCDGIRHFDSFGTAFEAAWTEADGNKPS